MSTSTSRIGSSKGSLGNAEAPATENLDIGSYREMTVAVKRLAKTGILLNREDQMELKVVSTK